MDVFWKFCVGMTIFMIVACLVCFIPIESGEVEKWRYAGMSYGSSMGFLDADSFDVYVFEISLDGKVFTHNVSNANYDNSDVPSLVRNGKISFRYSKLLGGIYEFDIIKHI